MAHPGDSPDSGYAKMYTGKPSLPGKTQRQVGYGLVKGDGVGYEDNADSTFSGNGEWVETKDTLKNGLPKGKRTRIQPSRIEQS